MKDTLARAFTYANRDRDKGVRDEKKRYGDGDCGERKQRRLERR